SHPSVRHVAGCRVARTTPRPTRCTLFPYTTLFRSKAESSLQQMVLTERYPVQLTKQKHTWKRCMLTRNLRIHFSKLMRMMGMPRSEEHTSELQSRFDLVCRLLLEKKTRKQRRSNQQ